MKRWKIGAGAGVAIVLVVGAVGLLPALTEPKGERAPNVSVQLLDGGIVSVGDYEGQVVLVNFWATWCPPCRLEMPGFQRVYEARRDDGFAILGLSTDRLPEEQVRWFLEQRGIGYPVGMATRYAAEAFGGARTLPTSILIDAEGRVRGRVTGVYDQRQLVADVDRLLREAGREPTGEVAVERREPPRWLDLEGVGHPLGNESAPVTVVEFSDYGCGYCSRFGQQTFPVLRREYIDRGRVRWLHVPFVLGKFPNSEAASRAAVCAAEQEDGVFWATHAALFRRQPEWREASDPGPVFRRYVEEAGGDVAAFAACLAAPRPGEALARAEQAALAAGVTATPTFFVNGRRIEGAAPLEEFRRALDSAAGGS